VGVTCADDGLLYCSGTSESHFDFERKTRPISASLVLREPPPHQGVVRTSGYVPDRPGTMGANVWHRLFSLTFFDSGEELGGEASREMSCISVEFIQIRCPRQCANTPGTGTREVPPDASCRLPVGFR